MDEQNFNPVTPENHENDEINKNTNSETLNDLEINTNPTKDFFYFVADLLKTGIIVFIIAFSLRYFVNSLVSFSLLIEENFSLVLR